MPAAASQRSNMPEPADGGPWAAARPSKPAVSFGILTTLAELCLLRAEWDGLVAAASRPSPFMLHTWLEEWLRHYGEGVEARVHVAHRDGRLVGALPLVVRRRHGLRVAGFLGGDLTNFADVLVAPGEPEATAAELMRRARSGHDYAHFHGVSRDSRIAACADVILVERAAAPVADLRMLDEYAGRLSHAELRKKRRRLDQRGEVAFRILRSEHEVAAAMDELVRLHELRWQGRFDGSEFATPAGRRFHRAVYPRLASEGKLWVMTLELDGAAIAFSSVILVGVRAYGHRPAHDPAYSRGSPGMLLAVAGLEALAASGVEKFEFMGGANPLKTALATDYDPIHDGFGFTGSLHGWLLARALHTAGVFRKRAADSDSLRRTFRTARDLKARARQSPAGT
jgi:CelD/BcsL family acetyltransferase involved in cellulose biosynthesis